MKKSQRLLSVLQLLRQYRYPVTAKVLAEKLSISVRTVYRDIADLQAQGAEIEGEAGLGFQLKPGFLLPPLNFSQEEMEAMVLGMRWVKKKADSELQNAATSALSKIAAVLPTPLANQLAISGLMVPPSSVNCLDDKAMIVLRHAISQQSLCEIDYSDINQQQTTRTVWPLGIAYFENVRVLIAWCELRKDFRHFRTDRLLSLSVTAKRYQPSRAQLLKQWRQQNQIPEQ